MKAKQIGFVAIVFSIALSCMGIMNLNYDILSRYPYKNKEQRQLIRHYLNKEDIEYIIEYSIAPTTFINFIQEDGFSIYRIEQYNALQQFLWQESPAKIVSIVNETKDFFDIASLKNYLVHYTYEELQFWMKNGDIYYPGSTLSVNAGQVNAFVSNRVSISNRKALNIEELSKSIPKTKGKKIYVDTTVALPLHNMCIALEEVFPSNGCGGLVVDNGYQSYEELVEQFNSLECQQSNSKCEVPGHSEHQLGLAIDFLMKDGSDFKSSLQAEWIAKNAYVYGFSQTMSESCKPYTDKEENLAHLRFVGYDVAYYLHENNINFFEYMSTK